MGPARTKEAGKNPHKNRRKPPQKEDDSKLGVQKIKGALRQTRRLLAKDKLAADVRIETERRLKSLEGDLERAQLSQKERKMAIRYHKAKFFERQKIVRKIAQLKKQINDNDSPALAEELLDQRVNLNYILHYPKTSKYISLFPPEARGGESAQNPTSDSPTDHEREALRSRIRELMKKGELSSAPETNLASGQHDQPKSNSVLTLSSRSKRPHSKTTSQRTEKIAEVDDFFGEDAEDET